MSDPKVNIRVDGKTLFKGPVGEWVSKPPDIFKDRLRPDARPEPHMKAILVALADSIMLHQSMKIEVTTKSNGWSMEVTNG